jgi:homoserine O-acetyltransferase/O-succinyltransferase
VGETRRTASAEDLTITCLTDTGRFEFGDLAIDSGEILPQAFLLSLLATLEVAPEHLGGGRFSAQPKMAMRAYVRNYAGWAMSQDWYRAGLHLSSTGSETLEAFLDNRWEPGFTRRAAENLYAQAMTWLRSDISANDAYRHDPVRALQAIEARVLLMPAPTDLYFPVAHNAEEISHLRHAELRPIPTIWGHVAGPPSDIPTDLAFIRNAVAD